jgi:hypothetical protein
MANKTTRLERPANARTATGVSVDERRFVIDFGPGGAQKVDSLRVIEEGIASSSRRMGAFLFDELNKAPANAGGDWLSVVEISIKAYTLASEEASDESPTRPVASKAEQVVQPRTPLILTRESRKTITDCVEKGLAYALGENGRDVILSRLQVDYGFSFSEVPDYPGRFTELLDEILQGGARYIEERIVKELNDTHLYEGEFSNLKVAVQALASIDSEQS